MDVPFFVLLGMASALAGQAAAERKWGVWMGFVAVALFAAAAGAYLRANYR